MNIKRMMLISLMVAMSSTTTMSSIKISPNVEKNFQNSEEALKVTLNSFYNRRGLKPGFLPQIVEHSERLMLDAEKLISELKRTISELEQDGGAKTTTMASINISPEAKVEGYKKRIEVLEENLKSANKENQQYENKLRRLKKEKQEELNIIARIRDTEARAALLAEKTQQLEEEKAKLKLVVSRQLGEKSGEEIKIEVMKECMKACLPKIEAIQKYINGFHNEIDKRIQTLDEYEKELFKYINNEIDKEEQTLDEDKKSQAYKTKKRLLEDIICLFEEKFQLSYNNNILEEEKKNIEKTIGEKKQEELNIIARIRDMEAYNSKISNEIRDMKAYKA